jgi:NodT family efflux transporter outer membrane factor (OMF) lipoprotein
MKQLSPIPFCLALALAASGCAIGPRYTPPQPVLPEAYSGAPASASADSGTTRVVPGVEAMTRWWFIFNDPELNSLVDRAVRGNLDLQLALSRVRQARTQRTSIAARLWPELDASGGYFRGRGSENVVLPFGSGAGAASGSSAKATQGTASKETSDGDLSSGNTTSNPPVTPSASPGAPLNPLGEGGFPGVTTNLYQVGVDASWEIDIFGGNKRALEAVDAGAQAAEEARRSVLVSLLAEVANTYLELRLTQQRLQIAQDNLAAQRTTLELVEAKARHGFATDLDVAQQRAQVLATSATLPALETATRQTRHLLAFLLGTPPTALDTELAGMPAAWPLPALVPVGVPSDLLRRRPDIRRAERELAEATAGVGVASADLLPKFDLTGSLGLDSTSPGNLLAWGSRYYSIAPGVRWPILDWGRIRANIRLQSEREDEAFLNYQKTVLQALKDVEDALVRYTGEETRRTALAAARDAARQAHELAGKSYAHGLTDLMPTLDSQRELLRADDTLAQSDGALRQDLITLYKALGGGWEVSAQAQ